MVGTGRFGSTRARRRFRVGESFTFASVLRWTSPSSEPVYTASPPPIPIADRKHPRAPLGAVPVQPVVRSGLLGAPFTSPAAGALASSVRYRRYVPRNSWFGLRLFSTHGT